MIKRLQYKFLFLGILALAGFIFSIPSLKKDLPKGWGRIMPTEGMRLGLDLQGGMHLILKVNLPRAVQNHLDVSVADLKDVLKKKKVPVEKIETVETNRVRLYLPDVSDSQPLQKVLSADFPNLTLLSDAFKALRRQFRQHLD